METLFGTEADIVKIKIKSRNSLTKNQRLFNSYATRIENLESEIIQQQKKYDQRITTFEKIVKPLLIEYFNEVFEQVKILDSMTKRFKFTKPMMNNLAKLNTFFLNIIGELFNKTDEFFEIYRKYSDIILKKIEEERLKEWKKTAKILEVITGKKVDNDLNDPHFREFMEEDEGWGLDDIIDDFYNNFLNEDPEEKPRKKSKKQLEAEEILKNYEALKQKSLRSIYIGLAKVLHPDKETDENLKDFKDDLMKKVTNAYNEKDLATLLKLELEFTKKQTAHFNDLDEQTLEIYIQYFKDRVKELENDRDRMMFENPSYQPIIDIIDLPDHIFKRELDNRKKSIEMLRNNFQIINEKLKTAPNREQIMIYVKNQIKTQMG